MAKKEMRTNEAQRAAATGGAPGNSTKAERKHTGASKRQARRKYGAPVELHPLDGASPAKCAEQLEENGRIELSSGRKQRATAEDNLEAAPAIRAMLHQHQAAAAARGLSAHAVGGMVLLCERLSVLVEVAALSVASTAAAVALDDAAFVGKRRDAIVRVLPGHGNAPVRAKFGLHQPVNARLSTTVKAAALGLLAGRKSMAGSRAAMLLTADDEKRLKAIVKKIQTTHSQSRHARAEGVSRTTERDILNTALELFYDDYAATIGLVLEDDEVARVQALELVPRRAERRTSEEATGGQGGAGSAEASAPPASPALVKA